MKNEYVNIVKEAIGSTDNVELSKEYLYSDYDLVDALKSLERFNTFKILYNKDSKMLNFVFESHIEIYLEELIDLQRAFEKYHDFGPTLAHEKIREIHGIKMSLSTLRNLMIANNIWTSKKIKKKRVFQMREKRSCLGDLIQVDGSKHKWFEDRGSMCTLLVYIDDATSTLMELEFVEEETTWDYLEVTKRYLKKHGRPIAFYTDKHSVFRVNSKDPLSGNGITQFARVLTEVKIEIIHANSPQAKGLVEKTNGTLQAFLELTENV